MRQYSEFAIGGQIMYNFQFCFIFGQINSLSWEDFKSGLRIEIGWLLTPFWPQNDQKPPKYRILVGIGVGTEGRGEQSPLQLWEWGQHPSNFWEKFHFKNILQFDFCLS